MLETVLFTLLHALTAGGFLLLGVAAAHLLVRGLRDDHDGRLRERDHRTMLAGAVVLFVLGFVQVVGASVVGEVETASLAALALGFCGVTYLLFVERPALFDVEGALGDGPGDGEREESADGSL